MSKSTPLFCHVPLQILVGEATWQLWGVIYNVNRAPFQLVNVLFWLAIGLICVILLAIYKRAGWKCWPVIPAFFVVSLLVYYVLSAASKGNLGPGFLQNETLVITACVLATSVTSIWLDRVRFPATKPAA